MDKYEQNLQTLIDKVEGRLDVGWSDVRDQIGADIHTDSLRKAFATTEYGGYAVAKYLMNKTASELTDDMLARLQDKKNEEYKERVRLQDARREYNKELRAEARYENLVDVMRDMLSDISQEDFEPYGSKHLHLNNKSDKTAILMLSDWHYGALCDSQWNYYNTEVAEKRVEQLTDKVIKYILNMSITDLVVEINGDMIEGLISISGRVSSEESAVEQIVGVSKLLIKCINSFKPYVK